MKITDIYQAFRFLGISCPGEADIKKANKLSNIIEKSIKPRSFFVVSDLIKDGENFLVEKLDLTLSGSLAHQLLNESEKIIVIAASLGLVFDQKLHQISAQNMADGLLFDALGSALVESALDDLEEELSKRLAPYYLTDRFSAGYGDLPLELQKEMGEKLDLYHKLGVVVEDSCMMNPTKSVTAFIGLSKKRQPAKIRGCSCCSLQGKCSYRTEGKRCYE